jgi:hypothetical protein
MDSAGLAQDPLVGSCEHGNAPSGSINNSEFLDQMNDHQLLKVSVPWS